MSISQRRLSAESDKIELASVLSHDPFSFSNQSCRIDRCRGKTHILHFSLDGEQTIDWHAFPSSLQFCPLIH